MELRRSYLRRHRRKQVVHDCATAAPALFGRHEPASLFLSCDSRENQFSQEATSHEGVLVCATCERAPAVVTCIADAAALCAICAEIHSVSSLARRHHHTPVLTFHPPGGSDIRTEKACTNPFTNDADKDDAFFPSEEVNQYLNLTELDDLDAELQPMCSERVVPFSRAMAEEQQQLQQQKHHLDASTFPLFGYSESFNNSVSVPSMKAITVSDVAAAGMNGLPIGCHQPQIQLPQFSSLDREARVLRYKEKKKARNFEKTIRYATRKAYAEARPRIRGRFARRSDAVAEAGKKLSDSATSEDGYGIVPSFHEAVLVEERVIKKLKE